MSLSSEKMMLLMALADGELDGDELAEAEALVVSNDEARAVVEAMRGPASAAIGEWVASSQVERAIAGGAESIAGTVMQRIAAEAKPKVASLDAARDRRDARLKAAAFVVAVASLAAGVFFYVGSDKVLPPPGPAPIASGSPPAPVTVPMPSPSALASADPAPAEVPSPGPEVTIESSTSHDVTVFTVPASIGAAVNTPGSVIVWIGDDKPQGK